MHTDSKTGQLLHDDHHRTIDLLNAFEAYLERMEDDIPHLDADGRGLLATLGKELGQDLERHFLLEEQCLFPPIAAAGAYEMTADLSTDHEALRPLVRRIARLCALALREGFDEESWPAFRHFGHQLIDGLVLHIQKEETALLSAVDAVLTPSQDVALARAYRPGEEALGGVDERASSPRAWDGHSAAGR
ncbi:hemerythrin domain-containing protein (plasmid) [Azospirillum brasilense]|uniref:Hemerythrin domain-containing protein n=1 Tax=Azospirillum brasilense TaxID=192 RepID=A0A4D8R539_AZOBR|nr:hemerythrin domain-containing protein [Azospirillum brasilense]QCO18495.1 hemerythrin domain-containing protein [Azospirillum brasilense]